MVVAAAVSLYLQLCWTAGTATIRVEFALLHARHGRRDDGRLGRRDVAHAAEPRDKLVDFYRRVRPAGPGWKSVAAEWPGRGIARPVKASACSS